jgi:Zn/Cd-binding protein ZinT
VQTHIAKYIAGKLSDKLHTTILVESASFQFFNKLVLGNVYIADQKSDTLFFTRNLIAEINSFSISKKEVNLGTLLFSYPVVNLAADSNGITNFQFIIDGLKSQKTDTSKTGLIISCSNFEIEQARFSYKKYQATTADTVINFGDLYADNFNLKVNDINIRHDTISFEIKNLAFNEKSGFRLSGFSSCVSVTKGSIGINGLKLRTPYTDIEASRIAFLSDTSADYRDFTSNIKLEADLKFSKIGLNDLTYFSSGLRGIDQAILLSGHLSGKVSNLNCRKMDIQFGKRTVITGNFNLIGLPDIDRTFIHASISRLITNKEDIENFHLPVSAGGNLKLPDIMEKLGTVTYTGTFSGYISDFVAYGTLNSELGNISADLSMNHESNNKQITYNGKIGTSNFNLGRLLDNNLLGKYTVNAEVKGMRGSDNHLTARLNGKIESAGFNNYEVQNIEIKGDLTDKRFDGFIYIKDKNLNLDFSGVFDFTPQIPEFNFTAFVSKANLYKLNIYKTEGNAILSFLLQTHFKGSNIDNLNGKIELSEIEFLNKNKKLYLSNISVKSVTSGDQNNMNINSDILDAEIDGMYNLQSVFSALKNTFAYYFPSMSENKKQESYPASNFNFNIRFGKSHDFCDMFIPSLNITPGTVIKGNFNSALHLINTRVNSSKLLLGSNEFYDLNLMVSTVNDSLKVNASTKSVVLSNSIQLAKFDFFSMSRNDNSSLAINWSGKDIDKFRGKINASLEVHNSDVAAGSQIIANILPSQIIINDSIWQLVNSSIVIRKSQINVNDFILKKELQYLKITGKISELESDTLLLDFRNINLHNFSMLMNTKGFDFEGNLNGKARLSNIYNKPLILSNIDIQDFKINNQLLGHTIINSNWYQESKKLHLNLYTTRDEIRPLNISGDFFPDTKKIDFAVKFDKFRLKFFQPFLKNILSDMNGMISETINLFGTIEKPMVYGKLNLQKVTFMIDYLKTRYNFSDYVEITNNSISFDNIRIYDVNGNYSTIKGSINHKYFKNITIDLVINSDNFLCLNTREADNSLYYGTAYATGITTITGGTDNIQINVSAKTGRETRFFIPLSSGSEISENNFITFISHDSLFITDKGNKQVSLSGIRLNFDLEVTPDAEVQMIFNSKTGDIIKARGNSNLRMEINTLGEFNIYGEYVIDEGEYTFTLENFLSKKFQIKKGGSLKWNGDPYNADMDIDALYTLNTSLEGLYLDTSEVYRQRLPVLCQIDMTGKLMNPSIAFGIDIPQADEKDRDQLKSLSQDELNKQFLSLLLINRFQPLSYLGIAAPANIGSTSSISESASEFLSNQLSHWISQISNDFDIGFNYRPGDQLTKDEVEVALKTQLFNDRLSINGKVSTGGQYSQTNNMVGDFEMDYKLDKSGKVRIKAYNNSNDNIYNYDLGPYTQGVGIFYREEFNSLHDLLRKFLPKVDEKNK